MTFIIKTSGDPTSLIVMEYMCPEHGRFESLEPRATAPDSLPCPEIDPHDVDCGLASPWSPSAPKPHMAVGVVQTGSSVERPPTALDTRPLADGMKLSEWKKREQHKDRVAVRDKLIKKGILSL